MSYSVSPAAMSTPAAAPTILSHPTSTTTATASPIAQKIAFLIQAKAVFWLQRSQVMTAAIEAAGKHLEAEGRTEEEQKAINAAIKNEDAVTASLHHRKAIQGILIAQITVGSAYCNELARIIDNPLFTESRESNRMLMAAFSQAAIGAYPRYMAMEQADPDGRDVFDALDASLTPEASTVMEQSYQSSMEGYW